LLSTGRKDMVVSTKGNMFIKNAAIYIGEEAIKNLSIKELKAVIAHELGHIKHGLRKVEIYKFLSALALIPNSYLSLVLNPSILEFKADEFSVRATGDKDSLVSALVKTSVYNIENTGGNTFEKLGRILPRFLMPEKVVKGLERFVIFLNFLFGEALLGYAHPPLSLRLAHIKQIK